MRFTARHDVELPASVAFETLCDAQAYERQLLRRGVEVQRLSGDDDPRTLRWHLKLVYADTGYDVTAHVEEYRPSELLILVAHSRGLTLRIGFEVSALSRRASRITANAMATAEGISARLKLSALRLTAPNLDRRLNDWLGDLANDLERRAVKDGRTQATS